MYFGNKIIGKWFCKFFRFIYTPQTFKKSIYLLFSGWVFTKVCFGTPFTDTCESKKIKSEERHDDSSNKLVSLWRGMCVCVCVWISTLVGVRWIQLSLDALTKVLTILEFPILLRIGEEFLMVSPAQEPKLIDMWSDFGFDLFFSNDSLAVLLQFGSAILSFLEWTVVNLTGTRGLDARL